MNILRLVMALMFLSVDALSQRTVPGLLIYPAMEHNKIRSNSKANDILMRTSHAVPTVWSYDSVLHLLTLMRQGEASISVENTLRGTNPRGKHFSNANTRLLEVIESKNPLAVRTQKLSDDTILTISNYKESKLPSSHITVKELREILEARAIQSRATTKPFFIKSDALTSSSTKKQQLSLIKEVFKVVDTIFGEDNDSGIVEGGKDGGGGGGGGGVFFLFNGGTGGNGSKNGYKGKRRGRRY